MVFLLTRNKAIKALDERLKKSNSDSGTAWPSLEEDEVNRAASEVVVDITQQSTKSSNLSSSPDGSASPDIVTIDMDSTSAAENNA